MTYQKKILFALLIIFISGCGSSLTLKQRYDNSISELESYTSDPANFVTTGATTPYKSTGKFKGFNAVLDYLKSNGPETLKEVHFVYYVLGDVKVFGPKDQPPQYYSLIVYWVGDKLKIAGIRITDSKNGDTHNIPLPDDYNEAKNTEGLTEQAKKVVYYAAFFEIDEKTHQELRKEIDSGDKLELEAIYQTTSMTHE